MSAESALRWPVGQFSDAPFVADDSRVFTHGMAAQFAMAIAAGVQPGARVLIVARPTVLCIVSVLACWARGAMAIVIDGREPIEARDLVAQEFSTTTITMGNPPLARDPLVLSLPLENLAVALRTSGSTGTPKFAVHRLASLIANARAANARTPFGVGDRWLLSLAPHHIGGLAIVVRAMVGGGAHSNWSRVL